MSAQRPPGVRPRLLILTPRFPYPVVGGDRLRIWRVCRALASEFDLTLLSLVERRDDLRLPVPEDGVFAAVERFWLPRAASWAAALAAVPTRTPLQVAYYGHAGFRRRVAQLAASHDGVFAHLIRTADATLSLDLPRFCELTDAISLNYERAGAARRGVRDVRAVAYALERPRLRAYERRVIAAMDHAFLVSGVDRDFLAPPGDPLRDRVSVCPNGVDLAGLPFVSPRPGADLVFVGNLTSMQNLDAALFAARDVLPLVRRVRPDARLRVVGRIDRRRAAQFAAFDGVTVTGEVGSIPDAAASGAVGLAPMRIAAGVQNKVLEYCALGLPAVVTPMALEGLPARAGEDLLVGEDARGVADAVLRLLGDPEFAARVAANGRAYVERHHDWDALLRPLVNTVAEGVRKRRG